MRKINFSLQTLEVGANDRSAQELQNAEKNERGGSEYYQIFD
jgi:hypothetical protein